MNYLKLPVPKPDLDSILCGPYVLLQYRVLGFMKAYAVHDVGELTDEEYAFWKSRFPAFQNDFYQFRKRTGRMGEETFEGNAPVPSAEPKNQQWAVTGKRQNCCAARPEERSVQRVWTVFQQTETEHFQE